MPYTIQINFIDHGGDFCGCYGLFDTPQEAVDELISRGWNGPRELNENNYGTLPFSLVNKKCHYAAKIIIPKDVSMLPRLMVEVEDNDFIGSHYPFGDLKLT